MNRTVEAIRRQNPALAKKIEGQHGFLRNEDIDALTETNRMTMVLVRCGNGRFVCPVQNVKHFIAIIEEHYKLKGGGKDVIPIEDYAKIEGEQPDYIRDVSIPADACP